jgi:hypothetical protein
MGMSMQTVEDKHSEIEEHTKTIGLTINTTKTKVMIQSRRDLCRQQIETQDTEAVSSSTYRLSRNRINKRK